MEIEGSISIFGRSSRKKIGLKIQTSGELRESGEGWSRGRSEKEEGGGSSFFRSRRWKMGGGYSFFRPRRSKMGGSSFFGAGRSQKPPSSKSPLLFKEVAPPPVFCSIFGPLFGAEDPRWRVLRSSVPPGTDRRDRLRARDPARHRRIRIRIKLRRRRYRIA